MTKADLAKKIITYYSRKSHEIASESIQNLNQNRIEVYLYDEEFYYSNLSKELKSHDATVVMEIITEHKLEIDELFLQAYRMA